MTETTTEYKELMDDSDFSDFGATSGFSSVQSGSAFPSIAASTSTFEQV